MKLRDSIYYTQSVNTFLAFSYEVSDFIFKLRYYFMLHRKSFEGSNLTLHLAVGPQECVSNGIIPIGLRS